MPLPPHKQMLAQFGLKCNGHGKRIYLGMATAQRCILWWNDNKLEEVEIFATGMFSIKV